MARCQKQPEIGPVLGPTHAQISDFRRHWAIKTRQSDKKYSVYVKLHAASEFCIGESIAPGMRELLAKDWSGTDCGPGQISGPGPNVVTNSNSHILTLCIELWSRTLAVVEKRHHGLIDLF